MPKPSSQPDARLPVGTVTLLFTDIVGSTRLWEQHGDAFIPVWQAHDAIVRDGIRRFGGYEVKSEGDADWRPLDSLPELAGAFIPPPISPAPVPATNSGLNVLIPYKNPRALVAYYLGVFAVIPFIGILLGLTALVLGILGLRYRRRNPAAGGVVHAWIGIVAGGLFGFGWLALTIFAIIAAIGAGHH